MPLLTRRRFLGVAAQTLGMAMLMGRTGIAKAAQISPQTDQISLDYKIAQMLMLGFHGAELTSDNPIAADIALRGIGGVILFDHPGAGNIQSSAQLKQLTADLQALALGSLAGPQTLPVPLLIAVDQEGGNVVRLKQQYGFPSTVSEQYLGTRNDLLVTHLVGGRTASTLAAHGINLNLAPVVDLNTNPANPVIGGLGRSYSGDYITVTNHALETIAAHHEHDVLTTLKHFPGHGSSHADSHLGFVDVTATWSEFELEPFDKIIKSGICDVIMTAHIFNARLDPDLPATLSHPTITGLLRERLMWDGVVMTDDMQMKAITDHYTFDTALELAINAGVDIITIGNDLAYGGATAQYAIDTVKALISAGKISPERIDQSYARITLLKQRLLAAG